MPALIATVMTLVLLFTVVVNNANLTQSKHELDNRESMVATAAQQFERYTEASFRYLTSSVQSGSEFGAKELIQAGLLPASFPRKNPFGQEYKSLVGVYPDGVTTGLLVMASGKRDSDRLRSAGINQEFEESITKSILSQIQIDDLDGSDATVTGRINVDHEVASLAQKHPIPSSLNQIVNSSDSVGNIATLVAAPAQNGYTMVMLQAMRTKEPLNYMRLNATRSYGKVIMQHYSAYPKVHVQGWARGCPESLGYRPIAPGITRKLQFSVLSPDDGINDVNTVTELVCVPSLKSDAINSFAGSVWEPTKSTNISTPSGNPPTWEHTNHYNVNGDYDYSFQSRTSDMPPTNSVAYRLAGGATFAASSTDGMPYVNNDLILSASRIFYTSPAGSKSTIPPIPNNMAVMAAPFLSLNSVLQFKVHVNGETQWASLALGAWAVPTGTGGTWSQLNLPEPDLSVSGFQWNANYSLWGGMQCSSASSKESNVSDSSCTKAFGLGTSGISFGGGTFMQLSRNKPSQIAIPARYEHHIAPSGRDSKVFDILVPQSNFNVIQ